MTISPHQAVRFLRKTKEITLRRRRAAFSTAHPPSVHILFDCRAEPIYFAASTGPRPALFPRKSGGTMKALSLLAVAAIAGSSLTLMAQAPQQVVVYAPKPKQLNP